MTTRWIITPILLWILCGVGILGNYAWQSGSLRQQSIVIQKQYLRAQWVHQKISYLKAREAKPVNLKRSSLGNMSFSEQVLQSSRRFGLSLVSFQVLSSSDYQGTWIGTLKQWKTFLSKGVLDARSIESIHSVQCPTKNCFMFEAIVRNSHGKR